MSSVQKKQQIVIIGAIAGGATAAARLHRLDEKNIEVTLIDKTDEISRASCGEPYLFSGTVDRKALQLQSATGLEKLLHQKILTNTTALKIDRARKVVVIAHNDDLTKTRELPYDKCLLSPGAEPIYPSIPGILAESNKNFKVGPTASFGRGKGDYALPDGIFCLQTLKDTDRINEFFHLPHVQTVCVIGTGFIGLESAEQFREAKFKDSVGRQYHKNVLLLEVGPTVLPAAADKDMGLLMNEAVVDSGVRLECNVRITHIGACGDGKGFMIETGKHGAFKVDMILLATGVRPRSDLAKDAGLVCGLRGHIRVNDFMQSETDPHVYAVGDAIEFHDFVFPQEYSAVALGNLANQAARVAADHMVATLAKERGAKSPLTCGANHVSHPMPAFLGTAIVRAFDKTFACTGWSENRLKRFKPNVGYQVVEITNKGGDHATYFPGAEFLSLKVIYAPETGKILGAQAVGHSGVDKRIDIIATAMMGGMSVDQLASLQLCYSPMYGSARDTVNVAGLAARNARQGLVKFTNDLNEWKNPENKGKAILIDVRGVNESRELPMADAIKIPFGKPLEDAIKNGTIDKSKKIYVCCIIGRTGYFGARMLAQAGYDVTNVSGGVSIHNRSVRRGIVESKL